MLICNQKNVNYFTLGKDNETNFFVWNRFNYLKILIRKF